VNTTTYWRDLGERVVTTFLAGFLSALVANWTGVIPSDWKGWLLTGAIAGVASVVKGVLAKAIGDPNTPSLLSTIVTRLRS
jgi:hypothetical protein